MYASRRIAPLALVLGLLSLSFGVQPNRADARPSYLRDLREEFPSAPDACDLCHTRSSGGGARNDFGALVDANRVGEVIDWAIIGAEDSDLDGILNSDALNDGLFPAGEADSLGGCTSTNASVGLWALLLLWVFAFRRRSCLAAAG